jgi:hypothetical protein
MANNYREILESIDAILDEEEQEFEEEGTEEVLSPKDLLKEIVGCLGHCAEKASTGELDQDEDFLEKLKKVRDILKQDAYTDEHQLDDEEEVVEEDSPFPEIQGNEHGTQGMGPSIDSSGKQNYDNPNGSSYAARKGFVGP